MIERDPYSRSGDYQQSPYAAEVAPDMPSPDVEDNGPESDADLPTLELTEPHDCAAERPPTLPSPFEQRESSARLSHRDDGLMVSGDTEEPEPFRYGIPEEQL